MPKVTKPKLMVASIAGLALASAGAAWGQDVAPLPQPDEPQPGNSMQGPELPPPEGPTTPAPLPDELPEEPDEQFPPAEPVAPADPEMPPLTDEAEMDPLDPSHMQADEGAVVEGDESDLDSPDGQVAPQPGDTF